MKRLILAGGLALSLHATAASATMANYDLTGQLSITEAYSWAQGGPTISNKLGASIAQNLTVGAAMTKTALFEADPDATCFGPACTGNTVTDTITISFTNLKWFGTSLSPLTTTATFTAKYSGNELACAVGDGVSPARGESDCIVWSGAPNTYNGSTTLSEKLSDGNTLVITLFNATDWNITPQIGFQVIDPSARIPEPATLAISMTALAGLAAARRRRHR